MTYCHPFYSMTGGTLSSNANLFVEWSSFLQEAPGHVQSLFSSAAVGEEAVPLARNVSRGSLLAFAVSEYQVSFNENIDADYIGLSTEGRGPTLILADDLSHFRPTDSILTLASCPRFPQLFTEIRW